jgi:hypothetical protein
MGVCPCGSEEVCAYLRAHRKELQCTGSVHVFMPSGLKMMCTTLLHGYTYGSEH